MNPQKIPLPLEYIAGYFDAKACIRIKPIKSPYDRPLKALWIDITGTEEIMSAFRDRLGVGSVNSVRRVPSRVPKKSRTPSHRLTISCKAARKALTLLEPFMIVQRELVQELLGIKESSGRTDVFLLTGPKEPNIMVVE